LFSVNTNHLYNSIYNSSCTFVFSLCSGLLFVTICTYVLFCTYGLCYFAFTDCVIVIVVALFALHCYSAIRIFIAASVRNKLILKVWWRDSCLCFRLELRRVYVQGDAVPAGHGRQRIGKHADGNCLRQVPVITSLPVVPAARHVTA